VSGDAKEGCTLLPLEGLDAHTITISMASTPVTEETAAPFKNLL
jgi:hypothetical protein